MIGVIADDLTGAAEIAALGFRRGLRSEVLLDGEADPDAGLVCLDSDSRACPPDEAARRVSAAADRLRRAAWIFKKTDSVLRGPLLAECDALAAALGRSATLLVPGNPSRGRTLEDGIYRIGGIPIAETDLARDPADPRNSSRVLDWFPAGQVALARPGEAITPRGITIGEAREASDLTRWAALADEVLPAGAADFFEALLEARVGPRSAPPTPSVRNGPRLFVCGSATCATRDFVESRRRLGFPVIGLPGAVVDDNTWDGHKLATIAAGAAASLGSTGTLVLHVGHPRIDRPEVVARIPRHLALLAARICRIADPAAIFAEGGATAIAVARELGWQRLRVIGEPAPGIVTLDPGVPGSPLLTLKPGSYPWPDRVLNAP